MSTVDILINNRFRLEAKLNAGSFGTVYRGLDIHTGDRVAIKIESATQAHPQLSYEFKIYEALQQTESPEARIGIPRVHWYGREGNYYVLVIDLLGCSLEDLFNLCNRKFSLKTTLLVGDQMISRIQYMHQKGYIHRDIKPDNFVVGRDEFHNCVYSIDFGLAKRYRNPETLKHIPYTNNRSLVGTARYASVHSHIGVEQSRRDDLEAIGYVLIYFLKGVLPWQGLKGGTKVEKFAGINESKMNTPLETLCLGLPQEFLYYFQHIRALAFEEKPDYNYLRRLFRELFFRLGYIFDLQYDWTPLLPNSKYGSLIFSNASITLQEQIITNTNFLYTSDAHGNTITNNNLQYGHQVDYNSMSFLLDSDVLSFYRNAAQIRESELFPDIFQRYTTDLDQQTQLSAAAGINEVKNDKTPPTHSPLPLTIASNPNSSKITATPLQPSSTLSHHVSPSLQTTTSIIATKADTHSQLSSATQFDPDSSSTTQPFANTFDQDKNERTIDGKYITDPIFPMSIETDSWTKQLQYLLDVKHRDQQQTAQHPLASHSMNGLHRVGNENNTPSDNESSDSHSNQTSETSSTAFGQLGQQHHSIYEVIRTPTKLEMMGTIQFAQKQFHTFALFLQLLCQQIIYLENAITVISTKQLTFKKHVEGQAKLSQKNPLLVETSASPLAQSSGKSTRSQRSTPSTRSVTGALINSPPITAAGANGNSPDTSTHSLQSPTTILANSRFPSANNYLTIESNAVATNVETALVQSTEEIDFLFEQQIIVLQQQLQYTRNQQQITSNTLMALHHYLRCLLVEHQNQLVMQITQGVDVNQPLALSAATNSQQAKSIDQLQLTIQQQRQLLQTSLKQFYVFDYNSLTDQREQIQRLFLQLKSIQQVREENFFQFMNVLRNKELLNYPGLPQIPNPNPLEHIVPLNLVNSQDNQPMPANIGAVGLAIHDPTQSNGNTVPHQIPYQPMTIGGPITPVRSIHVDGFPAASGIEDTLDITIGSLKDYIDLHQRLISLQDNDTSHHADAQELLQLSIAAGEINSVIKQHDELMKNVQNQNKRDVNKHGDQFGNQATIKDNIGNAAAGPQKSGLQLTKGKKIVRGKKDASSTAANPPTGTLVEGLASAETTTNPLELLNVPPSDPSAVHPGVRAALMNLSTLHFTPEDIKRVQSMPRLRDYGFHAAVNSLLQLEFENPNLIHMYLLYRKYLTKNDKHPRHFPILTSPQSQLDLSIGNDLNNIQSVLKLLLFYIKTLPVGSNNPQRQSMYNDISNELESLLTMEPNQMLHHLSSNNIYPRVVDELLIKQPGFTAELLNSSYDKYSRDKMIHILKSAKIPLPDDVDLPDLPAHELDDDIDVGVILNAAGDITTSKPNTSQSFEASNGLQSPLQPQAPRMISAGQKISFAQKYFLSLFPQDDLTHQQHNESIQRGPHHVTLDVQFQTLLQGHRYLRDPQSSELKKFDEREYINAIDIGSTAASVSPQ